MKYVIIVGTKILSAIYALMKRAPLKKRILFLSRQSNHPSLDFEMLAEKIQQTHPDYETVMLCKMLGNGILQRASYLFHILKQMRYLATSKVAILDSYCIPVSLLHHRKELLVIQMWHSIGTMKKFGHSILDQEEGSSSEIAELMHMHRGYDFAFAAGEGYKDHLAEGFAMDRDRILTYPLPRVERLQDSTYENTMRHLIHQVYPQLNGKTVLLYAPTFRKNDPNSQELQIALSDFTNHLVWDRYALIVKHHPLADPLPEDPRYIVDHRFSSMDLLFASDVIISDYSCIIYEAAILDLPIYLYAYDYDHYKDGRDMYLDYEKEMPGPICRTETELVQALEHIDQYDHDRLQAFLHRYVEPTGHETEDIVSFIFDQVATGSC